MKCSHFNQMFSPCLTLLGAEQGAKRADSEAGVWLVGRSTGHQHVARGDGRSGPRGAAGVSSGGEGRLQQAIAASARPQSPL